MTTVKKGDLQVFLTFMSIIVSYGSQIKIQALSNQHVCRMVAGSQSHLITICDHPSQLPKTKVNEGSWNCLTILYVSLYNASNLLNCGKKEGAKSDAPTLLSGRNSGPSCSHKLISQHSLNSISFKI